MTHRQRLAIAPLLEAPGAVLAIFRRAEEEAPGLWPHSSPAVHLETAQWQRILDEFGEKANRAIAQEQAFPGGIDDAAAVFLDLEIGQLASKALQHGLARPCTYKSGGVM